MAVALTRFRLAMLFYGLLAPLALLGFAALLSEGAEGFAGLPLVAAVLSTAAPGVLLTARTGLRDLRVAWRQRDPDSDPHPLLREVTAFAGPAVLSWLGPALTALP